jgi:uncharacterized membrane protein YpjA
VRPTAIFFIMFVISLFLGRGFASLFGAPALRRLRIA